MHILVCIKFLVPLPGINFWSSSNGTNNLNMHNKLVNKFLVLLLGILVTPLVIVL